MPERAIYLTSQDRDRLQALSQMTEDKDRGDLARLMYELSRAVIVPSAEEPPRLAETPPPSTASPPRGKRSPPQSAANPARGEEGAP